MTADQFVTYLRGIFEIYEAAEEGKKIKKPLHLNIAQTKLIRQKLGEVKLTSDPATEQVQSS